MLAEKLDELGKRRARLHMLGLLIKSAMANGKSAHVRLWRIEQRVVEGQIAQIEADLAALERESGIRIRVARRTP